MYESDLVCVFLRVTPDVCRGNDPVLFWNNEKNNKSFPY